jgi:PAS domain S-box-containing protein
MSGSAFQFLCLNDARLAAQALSPSPAWLWSADGARILWANPTGAAIFDAATPAAIHNRTFDSNHPALAQAMRLAGTLPAGGAARLERLRGFGANLGGALICLCSRITLADNSTAILIVSTERAGRDLALPERAKRLLTGLGVPAATFTADGELISATSDATESFGGARDLIALGAEKLAKEASVNGKAEGDIAAGHVTLYKLGAGATVVLLATLVPSVRAQAASPRIEPRTEPFMAPAPASAAPAMRNPASRKFPLRFVWQMDAATHFTLGTDDFVQLAGPATANLAGRTWAEIADALKLDPSGEMARALATRDTWSGIVLHWPINGGERRLPIEMAGLPVFDRDRQFAGYRGFGVCREHPAPLAVVPAVEKPAESATVLPFRQAQPEKPTEKPAALSSGEQNAFHELGRQLSDRLKKTSGREASDRSVVQQFQDDFGPEQAKPIIAVEPPRPAEPVRAAEPPRPAEPTRMTPAQGVQESRAILDRLPIGVLVYRLNDLVYANRAFLDWTGYETLDALGDAGGLDSLFIETKPEPAGKAGNGKALTITTNGGKQVPVEGHMFSITWNGDGAIVLMINTVPAANGERLKASDGALRRLENENSELKAVLETATDGVLLLDSEARVLSANHSAAALFGYEPAQLSGVAFGDLFAPESRRAVLDHFDRLTRNASASLDAGREVIARERQGGLLPLFLTMGRIEHGDKICAVLRDITVWKRTEEELLNAKRDAEKASSAKSEFLAKVSHEIRTPLNAIIGFSEVMMDERFGPVGNERYREYLKDIHSSGSHLIALLNDLLDLSKIESGKLELTFVSVNLNDLVQQCVAIMQEQANRERVIIRSALAAQLPQVVADARSVRQIALNLLSNSIKFSGAGGQVIVSTALTDDHEVVLRVRDTGAGMNDKELQIALEPFRQLATSARWGSGGTGLGLPITKALAEANRARFRIHSEVNRGTLVEIAFPATRVLAQ